MYNRPADDTLARWNDRLSSLSTAERLAWMVAQFGEGLVVVTAFGPSGIVILDELMAFAPCVPVITLDTGCLFTETYVLIAQVRARYPQMRLQIVRPALTPTEEADQFGPNLWQTNPDQCCLVRKVIPLMQALHGYRAWITGIRRDQSPTRAQAPFVQWDERYEMLKLAPLADISEARIWEIIHDRNLPYNALHDRGYPSIGCAPCTQPVAHGEDRRAGRWVGRDKTECGIHLPKRP